MRGVSSIQKHDNLQSPNCGRHAVSVVDTVNSLWLFGKGLLFREFLTDKHLNMVWVSWVNQWFKFDQTWVIGLSGCHARDTKHG